MDLLFLVPASLALGLVVGMLSGLLGIGGGTVMVPAFRLIYDMSALAATATSMLTIVPTSVSGMIAHVRNKTCVLKVGLAAGLGGACSSWIGVILAEWSPGWCVMAAAAAVIVYSATTMLKKALAMKPAKASGEGVGAGEGAGEGAGAGVAGDAQVAGAGASVGAGSKVARNVVADGASVGGAASASASTAAANPREADAPVTKNMLVKSAVIGLSSGVLSGYVGVGGGFIMVPLFLSKLNLPMKKASGTSLVAVGILVLPALATQVVLGNVNWAAGLACIVGSIPGAALGAKLQARIPERALRFCFAGILGVAAVLLIVNELGFLG